MWFSPKICALCTCSLVVVIISIGTWTRQGNAYVMYAFPVNWMRISVWYSVFCILLLFFIKNLLSVFLFYYQLNVCSHRIIFYIKKADKAHILIHKHYHYTSHTRQGEEKKPNDNWFFSRFIFFLITNVSITKRDV